MFKNVIKELFRGLGLNVTRHDKVFPTLWCKAQEFIEIYEQVKPHAMASTDRCFMLYQLCKVAVHK